MKNPFHLAIPVNDLAEADNFYQHVLGCEKGDLANPGLTLTYLVISLYVIVLNKIKPVTQIQLMEMQCQFLILE